MRAWMIRPNPIKIDRMNEFLERNIIAVGWPRLPSLSKFDAEAVKKLLIQYYPDEYSDNPVALRNVASLLVSFCTMMQSGDYIVVPHKDNIYFGRVTSDYYYDVGKANDRDGYPHQRKAEWLKGPVFRDELPAELRGSLRSQMTLTNLTPRLAQIEELIGNKPAPKATVSDTGLAGLMAEAINILKAEMESSDPDRRLKAALEIMRLKKEGIID